MGTMRNRQIIEDIFSGLSRGDDKLLIEAMADDMTWNWMGTGKGSKSFVGKSSVVNDLMAAAKTTIKQPSNAVAHRILADGDYVAVECTGHNTTPDGKNYNNKYGWVCRFSEGKLH